MIGRRKEPILGYVSKNDEKENLFHKGLEYDEIKFQNVYSSKRRSNHPC